MTTAPTRLFDCLSIHLKDAPDRVMLSGKQDGNWKEYTTRQVSDMVNQLSAGLHLKGLSCGDRTPEGRDKIAVIAKNRPEWIILDLAVQKLGAVLTPVYPTIGDPELEYILNDAKVKIIFVNDKNLFEKVSNLRDRLPHLTEIYSFEKIDEAPLWSEIGKTCTAQNFEEVEAIAATIKFEDLATIIYTSGTTGKPKGVMLSHRKYFK